MLAAMSDMSNNDVPPTTPQIPKVDGRPEKPDRVPLMELKNGKIVFKQKTVPFEKLSETMQEIVKFREMLERRIAAREPPLDVLPQEHKPLIAKLVHESDKTVTALAKHIRQELLPVPLDPSQQDGWAASEALPLEAIENSIKTVATRINYGLEGRDGVKLPAAMCVWRWEVNSELWDAAFPKAAKEKAEERLNDRLQGHVELVASFEALPQHEKDRIFKFTKAGEKKERDKQKDLETDGPESKEQCSTAIGDDENKDRENMMAKKLPARPKKELDPEKIAKEKEKHEKKVAKAEKEKKEQEAQNKSRTLMASFFGKPKPSAVVIASSSFHATAQAFTKPITLPLTMSNTSTNSKPSSSSQSDFEKTFKPFVVKKDAELAPINWFQYKKDLDLKKAQDVIVIDHDDYITDMQLMEGDVQMYTKDLEPKDLLKSVLSTLPPSLKPPTARHRSINTSSSRDAYKIKPRHCVRDIISQLTEAEIVGDQALVRRLLDLLKDRSALPTKVFIFAQDNRPGYLGTFTRSSTVIGPRTPFARDAVAFDYSYDSGEDWEEEEEGADDLMSLDGEADDDSVSSVCSDLDDWLVGDEDEDEPVTPLEEREGSLPPVFPVVKRKVAGDVKDGRQEKKRKVVVPLVPFVKGPCWEGGVGRCEYKPFEAYRIKLFNDTPYPVNPFTFVSAPLGELRTSAPSDAVFAVPAVPDRPNIPLTSLADPQSDSSAPKRRTNVPAPPPKTLFPDAHLPLLVDRINQLATSNMILIVESVYQELKVHKVKKNAIEVKVKEVGEKCKEKKIWVVKENMQIS